MHCTVICENIVKALSGVHTPRPVTFRIGCSPLLSRQHRPLLQQGVKGRSSCSPGTVAGPRKDSSDKHGSNAVSESSCWVRQSIQRYPLSLAFGALFLVFVLPQLMMFGLVGVEHTALAILLELEELLVAVVLAGAKWVALAGTAAGLLALVWFESKKRRS